MTTPSDPLANAILGADRPTGRQALRIGVLFADRPEIMEAIIKARVEKRLGYKTIADIISSREPENAVSDTAVKNWLRSKGIN